MEDLNNVLNAGDVPNIYAPDELDTIYSTMKPVVQDEGLQPTKVNLFMTYTKRVRSNIHMVICMRYVDFYLFPFYNEISLIGNRIKRLKVEIYLDIGDF